MNIGFIGMGLMGIPMCKQLLAAGHHVCVWNRTPGKAHALLEAGAEEANSVAELVADRDVIMLCISDTEAVRSVIFDQNGVAEHITARQLLIDLSSIDPAATRTMAAKLLEKTLAKWVDAPVSGGVAGAEQGTLAIMVGADESAFSLALPVLQPLASRVTHMGPVGSGQVTKVCNQMIVSCNVLVMAEVFALAEKSGVKADMIPAALKGGFADSTPLQLTGPKMAGREFEEIKWHVKTLLKDLDLAGTLAHASHSATPMAGLAAELMRMHAARGFADQDPSTLIQMYTESQSEGQR